MGTMTTTLLCQLLSFTIWFHKTNRVSALNGCLVSVGPAGSGSEECSHAEPALLQGELRHREAWLCWGLLQDVALHPILFLWRGHVPVRVTMSCPPKVPLIMIRPVLPSYPTDQSCFFICLVELRGATLGAWGRSTKSHPFHYYYLPVCTALPGSRRGRGAAPSWRRTG